MLFHTQTLIMANEKVDVGAKQGAGYSVLVSKWAVGMKPRNQSLLSMISGSLSQELELRYIPGILKFTPEMATIAWDGSDQSLEPRA